MNREDAAKRILEEVAHVGSPKKGYHPETIVLLGQHLQQYIEQCNAGGDVTILTDLWLQIASLPDQDDTIYGKLLAEFELLEYTQNSSLTDYYLRQIGNGKALGWRNQLYLLRQLQSLLFTGTVKSGEETAFLSWKLYDQAYTGLRKELLPLPAWIPEDERTQDFVIVTTSQLLSEQHAPTKTALDRCFVLMQELGKKVLLINTAEQGADIGNVLLFHRMKTNYKKVLSRKSHIDYRGISIPFLQCSLNMPEVAETRELIALIEERKPEYIINIGGSSLVTDLLSEVVPVLTIATVFSGLATTRSQYQMIGRSLTDRDEAVLAARGKNVNHVISGRFTFALKEQTQTLSKSLLGIPEDAFTLVVIGARIGREITEEFVSLLEELADESCFIVFVGEMDYDGLLSGHAVLQGQSVYLGSRSDVLAVMEQMDVYVNPRRNGGGSSVVEAMVKGVVPVTLPCGDVYVNTGDSFAVPDYSAMKKEILRCRQNPFYYKQKSKEARERAAVLMDSTSAFVEVLEEFQRRLHRKNDIRQCDKVVQIDVLIAVAERGGVENVIKMMIDTLESPQIHFRIVQLVWEGYRWVDADVEFHPLLTGRAGHTLQEFIEQYYCFVQAQTTKPDIILATGWPYLCMVAKEVIQALGMTAKVVSWLHCGAERYEQAGYGGLKQLEYADVHFAISEKIKKQIQDAIPNSIVYRIYNPVELPEDFSVSDLSLSNHLLYVGRLSKEKNVGLILKALAQAENWKLSVVGAGEEEEHLKQQAAELEIADKINWMGWQEEPWDCAESVDAVVLSSFYEGFPVIAIEAMGRGIPVISSRVDGITELIESGQNGYIYEQGDVSGLLSILLRIQEQGYVVPDVNVCRSSAMPFMRNKALQDMADKMKYIIENDLVQSVAGGKDTISVIIPCYNVEKYLRRCLDSIFGQRLSDARLEVICVDDASLDNTLEILKEYEKRYSEQMILIPLEENGKQGRARNIALEYATGDYIFYVDSDDYIAPDLMERLYQEIYRTGSDIVECDYQKVLEGQVPKDHGDTFSCTTILSGDELSKRRYIIKRGWDVHVWGKLYDRNFLRKYRISFPENGFMEDIYFSELCMLHAEKITRISLQDYYYMIHYDGTVFSEKILQYYMDTPKTQNMVTEYAKKNNLLSGIEDEFIMLHFSKAFAEPIDRMRRDSRFFSYPNIRKLKRDLFHYFSNLMENPYMMEDTSDTMKFYQKILTEDYTEKEMRQLFLIE